jgi:flagella basal body P-ring formation protein FlgA
MSKKNLCKKISLCLFMSILISNAYFCSSVEARRTNQIVVVRALRDIPDGTTIGFGDVNESTVSQNQLPIGVSARTKAKPDDTTYFLSSKNDAVGRISKGLMKGQILFFSYPGYRGNTVITAVKDIPLGIAIRDDSVAEVTLNPRRIPVSAIFSKREALGKRSLGILKGQTLTAESNHPAEYGGEFPTVGAGYKTRSCFYAVRKIPAGEILRVADVRQRTFRYVTNTINAPENFSLFVDGRRTTHAIDKGQIICESDLERQNGAHDGKR